jgi:hypothetical protein
MFSDRNRFVSDGDDFQMMASCGRCKHKRLGKTTCEAFPRGIPEDILRGDHLHTSAYPGDKGIRFEPIEE